MTRALLQQALDNICGAKLCEINSMSSRAETRCLLDKATIALRGVLAAPEPEPVALESVHLTRDIKGMCTVRVNGRVAIQDNGDIIDHMATLEWFAQPAPAEDFCYCDDDISLQMVSGGAALEGLYGRVTLKINGQYVDYVKAQPAPVVPLTAAASDVLAERKRQVEGEGWTAEYDSQHRDGSMALAAAVYALIGSSDGRTRGDNGQTPSITEILWPWEWSWFKPKSRRQNLIRAAALLLAEIERLDCAHDITGCKP